MPPSMWKVFRAIRLTEELERMKDWLIDNNYKGLFVAYFPNKSLLAGATFEELSRISTVYGYSLNDAGLMYVD